MGTLLKKSKWYAYAITLVVVTAIYGIAGFHSGSILDDFFIRYGIAGHIIILFMSFVIAFYLGFTNASMKWLYPFFVAGYVHFVLPFIVLMANHLPRYHHGFFYWLFIGLVFVWLPHIAVPLLGLIIGKLSQSHEK